MIKHVLKMFKPLQIFYIDTENNQNNLDTRIWPVNRPSPNSSFADKLAPACLFHTGPALLSKGIKKSNKR